MQSLIGYKCHAITLEHFFDLEEQQRSSPLLIDIQQDPFYYYEMVYERVLQGFRLWFVEVFR